MEKKSKRDNRKPEKWIETNKKWNRCDETVCIDNNGKTPTLCCHFARFKRNNPGAWFKQLRQNGYGLFKSLSSPKKKNYYFFSFSLVWFLVEQNNNTKMLMFSFCSGRSVYFFLFFLSLLNYYFFLLLLLFFLLAAAAANT